jgi:hypothetical protein
MTNCRSSGSFGPSGGEVAGIAIAAGAVVAGAVALEVHHSHHMLKGCVSSGPGGLELQTQGGAKTYELSGATANIKAGDRVLVHGLRVKQPKHTTADQTFSVERVSKDYGACKLNPAHP